MWRFTIGSFYGIFIFISILFILMSYIINIYCWLFELFKYKTFRVWQCNNFIIYVIYLFYGLKYDFI